MKNDLNKIHLVFNKKKNENDIAVSFVYPIDVISDIEKVYSNKENVYVFESGEKAKFLYERSCVNDLSFNYFQLYNKSVYECFKQVVKILQNFVKNKNINIEKNLFYITSEYETEFLEGYWYDSGGIRIPNFCGYWFLETNDDPYLKIDSRYVKVGTGSLVMFEPGSKVEFFGIKKGISFNITTISKLVGQYPQKWMPIYIS